MAVKIRCFFDKISGKLSNFATKEKKIKEIKLKERKEDVTTAFTFKQVF